LADWGDGRPEYSDFPAGAWGDGLPLGPAETTPPVPPVVISFIAEILVGDVVVWSSASDLSQQTLEIDVSSYNGKHDLKFRIRGI